MYYIIIMNNRKKLMYRERYLNRLQEKKRGIFINELYEPKFYIYF